jgi:hypothetical protein
MAALCTNPSLPTTARFYQRLRTTGKPDKVALNTVTRKLLILLNLALASQHR